MNNASLELGGTNWAEKDGNILGYSVGDTSGKYSPQEFTFARGSNLSATRIDRAGLIVKGRENVLTYSNDFSNVAWDKNIISITSGQADKDGGTTASRLTANSGGQFRRLLQATNENSVVAASIFVKSGTADFVYMVHTSGSYSSGGYQFFDLANGTLGASSFLKIIDSKIEDAGNGWYRCTLVSEPDAIGNLYIGISNNDTNTNVTSGLYVDIQDAQLEQGLAASPYIESGATNGTAGVLENTPRLNYTTGVANPYLLLEPSRTNSVTSSETFGSTGWTNFVTGTAITTIVTDNFAISPDGTKNAQRIQFNLGGGTTAADRTVIRQSITSQTNWVLSVYMKSTDGTDQKILWHTGGDSNETVVTGEWKRYTFNLNGTNNSWVGLAMRGTISTNNTSDILVYGFQAETGSYPTSYIPTYSVSATRAQDVCVKTNASGEIGQTEGTMFIESSALSNDYPSDSWYSISDGTAANRIMIGYYRNPNIIRFYATFQGTNVLDSTVNVGDISDVKKIVIAYASNDIVAYVNGSNVVTVTNTSSSVPNNLSKYAFENEGGTYPLYAKVNQAELYKERLTNAELATLTTI